MGFQGDFQSFPLPDLLQWLDASRKTGRLALAWDGGERRLLLEAGEVKGTSSPGLWERIARLLALSGLSESERVFAAFQAIRHGEPAEHAFLLHGVDPTLAPELAREELFGAVADLTLVPNGTFRWTEGASGPGSEHEQDQVAVELSTRALLFEALRWVDEQPEVDGALPIDAATVRARAAPEDDWPALERIILRLCAEGMNLGRLRLAMGVSRSTTVRRVYDLLRQKRVEVDGAPQLEEDPISDMLEKGALLLRERQYDAAGMVFQSLLASDPADRRVRDFAARVEREHKEALLRELPARAVPSLVRDAEAFSRLRPEERQVATLVNGVWDIGAVLLASKLRELDTLKALQKLQRQGLLQLREPRRA